MTCLVPSHGADVPKTVRIRDIDDDPPARVEWQATTRKIYLDGEYRQRQHDRDFLAGRARGR